MHPKIKTGRLQDQLLTEGVIWKQLVFFFNSDHGRDSVSTAL